jgi:homoserine dehydrogenase
VVDNTSSDDVATLYPTFLSGGLSVVTPNKKAYSSSLELYNQILSTSAAHGTSILNESTVGAGLPIISTLKDLVQTGDKVRMTPQVLLPHGLIFLAHYRSSKSRAYCQAP